MMTDGEEMHAFMASLFPICRSITGDGVRQTLAQIKRHLPSLQVREVPTGTPAFDWVVPDEWNITAAHLVGPDGRTVVDFANNNLHVVGYSEPVSLVLPLEELQMHLHSLPEMPAAIPYVTSYYKRSWGFCLPHDVRESLVSGNYRVTIESTLAPGSLSYGEIILPGESSQEVFLSTYVCHPSMANNELSGPVVTTWLAKWLMQRKRRYTYRIIFIPETIGSIVYLSRHIDSMRRNIVAGFNVTCVGDDRCYSFLPSRRGDTLSDRVARHVLGRIDPNYVQYSYLDRGSDERQYCSPGVDLPVCSVMRSMYGCYSEYHTSADDLALVTPSGLEGGYAALRRCLEIIEVNRVWRTIGPCEPQLGKRGLYPTSNTMKSYASVRAMMDLLGYADGSLDLLAIAGIIGADPMELGVYCEKLAEHKLMARAGE